MNKCINEKDYFKNQDICLVAALCSASGYAVEAVDKQNPKKAVFLIKRDDKLDEIVRQYWANQLLVEPKSFFNCLKELKTRIYCD